MLFDKHCLLGAPAEGFDAHTTGPGEQIENLRIHDRIAQDVKDCFLHPVGDGACTAARYRLQLDTFGATRDYAHVSTLNSRDCACDDVLESKQRSILPVSKNRFSGPFR